MYQVLLIYIILQSLLFSVVLIAGRKAENKPLVFYFSYLFLFHVLFMLCDPGSLIFVSEEGTIRTVYEFIALCNSAVVFYFLYSILEKPMPRPLYFLWLIPVAHILFNYIFKGANEKFYFAGFYENWYINFPFYIKILFTALLIWQIKVFNTEIRENGSSKKHQQLIKLYWGKYFVYFQVVLSSLLILYMLFTLANGRLYHIDLPQFTYSTNYYNMIHRISITFFMLVFGYLALRNPSVFNTVSEDVVPEQKLTGDKFLEEENSLQSSAVSTIASEALKFEQKMIEIVLPEEEKILQKKVELTEEQVKRFTELLSKLMDEDKVYLDPELSLNKLSKLSQVPARQLSQCIKIISEKNYREYINSYRVKYAQELLTKKNPTDLTIYSVALDSGFNSESTFYQVFKQQTNLTPKQYQDKFKSGV